MNFKKQILNECSHTEQHKYYMIDFILNASNEKACTEMKNILALLKICDDDNKLSQQWSCTWLVLPFDLDVLMLVVLDICLIDAQILHKHNLGKDNLFTF